MTDQANSTADLLIELGCEELPPKALATLAKSFFDGTCNGLKQANVSFDAASSNYYFTPRRMALLLAKVESHQPDRVLERKGPAVSAAFDDDGNPTPAAVGFARSVDRDVDQLDRLKTDKGEWLYCKVSVTGKPLAELLYDILDQALAQLPVPKPMRWSDHEFSFVRPVHWLVVLHGNDVIPGSLFGCEAGRETQGHRIHAPGAHVIDSAGNYLKVQQQAFVQADQNQRRATIAQQAADIGRDYGGHTRVTNALLDEVNNLVEWPVAIQCAFEERFLDVPQEALIASMEAHQKFFPILQADEITLTPAFVVIANIQSTDVSAMATGFERVIRPRLADAEFFWQQDLKQTLEARLPALDKIVFQQKLGTVGDKSRRIASISRQIAEIEGFDPEAAERAGLLCKCDLVTQMVSEFPELQGTMGSYYATHDNESDHVASAIGNHYLPRFAGDEIPTETIGRVVALADRLDTLCGIFSAGMKPTGSKDPFALRRAALGIIRILEEAAFRSSPTDLLDIAAATLAQQVEVRDESLQEIQAFVLERLRHHLLDSNATARQVSAVLSSPLNSLADLRSRLRALSQFMQNDDAASLVAANKRIGNIMKKADGSISSKIDTNLFSFDEETSLFDEVTALEKSVIPLFEDGKYDTALEKLAALRQPVDRYFDTVMVMDDDPAIRNNRMAQLARLKSLFDQVADFSVAD